MISWRKKLAPSSLHWRSMIQDPRLKEVFPKPPLVAYKRPKNIRDKIIRSKVPPLPSSRPKWELKGMKKCNKCSACPFVKEGKTTQSRSSNFRQDINSTVDCTTKNIIYLLVGESAPSSTSARRREQWKRDSKNIEIMSAQTTNRKQPEFILTLRAILSVIWKSL